MSYEIPQSSVVEVGAPVPETGEASAPFMPELMRLGKLRFAYTPTRPQTTHVRPPGWILPVTSTPEHDAGDAGVNPTTHNQLLYFMRLIRPFTAKPTGLMLCQT